MSITKAQALAEIQEAPIGEVLWALAAMLVVRNELLDEYGRDSDMPEPLQNYFARCEELTEEIRKDYT